MKKMMKNSVLWVVLVLAMMFACMAVTMAEDGAEDENTQDEIVDYVNAEEYTTGYYTGVINDRVSTSVNVRYGPGSDKYDVITTSDGTKVKLTRGTEVTIVGETKDTLMDVWYHIFVEFNGETIEGYCISDYIDKNVKVTFTPTPAPTDTPTPEPTEPEAAPTDEPLIVDPTVTPSQQTQQMIDDSDGMGPWVYILILSIVVVLFVVIYTVATKIQEERLEKEMERYSNRPGFQKLDGESDEDFNEAKQDYFDSLNLGDNGGRKVAKSDEEIELDLNGVFDEPAVQVTEEDIAPQVDDVNYDAEASEVSLAEEIAELGGWTQDDEAFMEHLKENAQEDDVKLYDRMKPQVTEAVEEVTEVAEELVPETVVEVQEAVPVVPVAKDSSALLQKLNLLKEQDVLQHKLYGEGEVIDNSDAEVIQVRFGRDLRFLKKEKLAKKELVELD